MLWRCRSQHWDNAPVQVGVGEGGTMWPLDAFLGGYKDSHVKGFWALNCSTHKRGG